MMTTLTTTTPIIIIFQFKIISYTHTVVLKRPIKNHQWVRKTLADAENINYLQIDKRLIKEYRFLFAKLWDHDWIKLRTKK